MKRILLLLLFATGLAYGQTGYTNVTGTIKDANQVPYANGRVSVTLPQGEVFIGTGLQPPNSGTAQLDSTGAFSLRLASNDQLSPAGSQWTFNICSAAGTTCFTSAQTITGTSQSLSSALSTASALLPVPTDFVREFTLQAAPANPPAGFILLYADSGTGNLTCLTSAGAACISGGGGGGGATIQVNGVNTANQSTINFINSAATNGLTLGFTNPSVGNVQLTLAGTLANAGLANSSLTVNTSSPLGGGGAVSLGGSLTLTCATCATSANNLSFFASTTSAQLAGVISNETGTGVLVFSDSPVFTTQITSPIFITGTANPSGVGVIRLANTDAIGFRNAGNSANFTLSLDASNILQSTATFNAPTLTQNTNAVADSTTTLNFFASTTSAQLASVISNETGTGVLMFNSSPSVTTPIMANFTVSTLPAAGTLGRVAVVTDGTTKTDCTSGGGSTVVWCIDSGSVWTSASISAGAGTVNNCATLGALAYYAATGTAVSCDAAITSNGSGTLTAAAFATASTSNGGLDGTEGTGAGLTPAAGHDLLWPDQTDHRWKMNNNNGTSNDVAGLGDNLGAFAATTSAQLAGVISDETGTGKLTFATAPTFLTSITTPVVISSSGDPADSGFIRMGNAEVIGWENATPGTDLTITMNASNVFTVSTPISATTGYQIGGAATSTHYLRGNGTNYVDSAFQTVDISAASITGSQMVNNTVTATQLAAQYSKGSCTEAWGGSGTSFALTSGDDAVVNNACYNDSGVTRTITAVKCRSDNASNTTTVNPTFGSAGTGTTILSGALTCGNSYAYSSTGTVSNASWTTGTGIRPVQGGTLTGTSIAVIVEYTY